MIFHKFMPSHVDIPKFNPPYSTSKFPEGSRHVISMLSFILGYFTDEFTDESILGFFSTLSPGHPPTVIFDFSRFIADSIHHQLTKLPTEGVFMLGMCYILSTTSPTHCTLRWAQQGGHKGGGSPHCWGPG